MNINMKKRIERIESKLNTDRRNSKILFCGNEEIPPESRHILRVIGLEPIEVHRPDGRTNKIFLES